MADNQKRGEWLLQAEYCKKFADQAASYDQKARWLELAAKWLRMIDQTNSPETAADRFEAALEVSGTGQDRSQSRN